MSKHVLQCPQTPPAAPGTTEAPEKIQGADAEIIQGFQWIDDDTPLPVNPDDPDEVAVALTWATRKYRRCDGEYFLALNSAGWRPGDAEILRHDRDALGRFKAALMRTLYAMRQKDRDALTAWTMGEPIRDDSLGDFEVMR